MKHVVEAVKLKNGASGLLIDIPSASVMNFRFAFRAGHSFAKSPDIYEVSHLMEHLAFGQNSAYPDEQSYEAEFTRNGAYHNAWTSDKYIVYEAECADFEWDRILELQELAIAQPLFNEDELKSEKSNVRSELTGYQNDYSRLIWPKLQQDFGEPVLTYAERLKTINNIDIKDIKEHHCRTHSAENLQFIIAGNLKGRKTKIISMLEGWRLRSGKKLEFEPIQRQACSPINIRRKDASNLSFGFIFNTDRLFDLTEQYALGCLNHILTGTMNSRIFGQARKRGIVYDVFSASSYDPYSSSWIFGGEVNAENATDLFDLIAIELQRILNGHIDIKEIEAAKSYALGRHQMLAQTPDQIGAYYERDYFLSGEYEDMEKAPAMIKNIKKTTMVNLTRELVGSNLSGLSVVSNVDKAFITELWQRIQDTV